MCERAKLSPTIKLKSKPKRPKRDLRNNTFSGQRSHPAARSPNAVMREQQEGLGTFAESPQQRKKRPFLLSYGNLCATRDLSWYRNYFNFSWGLLCSGGYAASINNHRSPSKPHRLPPPPSSFMCAAASARFQNAATTRLKMNAGVHAKMLFRKTPPARLYLSIHSVAAPALPRTFVLHMNQSAFRRQQRVVIILTAQTRNTTQIPFRVWARARFFLSDYIKAFFSPLQLLIACSYWEWVF